MSRNKKLWLGLGLWVLLVALVAIAMFPKHQVDNTTIRLGFREHDLYAPQFVGVEKGFFKAQDLNVETTSFASANQLIDALIGGKIDAVLGGLNTPLLFTVEQKQPGLIKIFTIVNDNSIHPASYLLVRPNEQITSTAQLANKKIGDFLGTAAKLLYNKIVQKDGLANTTLVQMDPKLELSALQSGQVDAVIVLEPLATVGQYKKIAEPLVKSLWSTYYLDNFPLAASVISSKFINEHPDLAKKLVTATNQSIDFMNANPAETKNIVARYVTMDPAVVPLINIAPHRKLDAIDGDQLQQLADILWSDKQLEGKINARSMLLTN